MNTLLPPDSPWLSDIDSNIYKIVCYVTDNNSLLDVAYFGPVEISYEGEDQPDPHSLDLTEGGILFDFERYGSSTVTITATIEGLGTTVLIIEGVTAIEETLQTAEGYLMKDNYPNPFSQSTTIEYVLPEDTPVKLAVYNTKGQLVETLVDEEIAVGNHRVSWNAVEQSSGTYYYQITSKRFTETKHCILLK